MRIILKWSNGVFSKSPIAYLIAIIFLCAPFQLANATQQLKLVIVLIRHGDRTSLHRLPNYPMLWEKNLGELTGLGMQQEYALGQQFRSDLIAKQTFLSKEYNPNEIHVRATSLDRTLTSAQMFLLGLYPPGTGPKKSPFRFQPIPIFTVPIHQDDLLHAISNNQAYRTFLENHVYSSGTWKDKEKSYKTMLERWSKLAGEKITLKNISILEDPINVALMHHKKIPTGFTKNDIKNIYYLFNWAKSEKFKSQEVGILLGGKLYRQIYNNIINASNNKPHPKFILYSASDTTIMILMSALGVPLKINPHYASSLSFKIYSDEDKNTSIKIFYNENPVKLPGCTDSCSPKEFYAIRLNHSKQS